MAMAATEIDRNGDVSELEFKSSDVSMDGSLEDHSQTLCDIETPSLTMETSTRASSTASLHDDIIDESDDCLEEKVDIDENPIPSIIEQICLVEGPCIQCEIKQPCSFRFTDNGLTLYVCNEPCIKAYQAEYPGKYTVSRKKYIIEEIKPKTFLCCECEQKKTCYFYHNFDGEETYYCSLNCLEGMMADEKDKYTFDRNSVTLCIKQIRPKEGQCLICEKVKSCEFSLVRYGEPRFLCERTCIKILSEKERGWYYIKKLGVSNAIDKNLDEGHNIQEKTAAMFQREQSFHRRCSQCTLILMIDEDVLTWEAMDFCDEICLESFQNGIGSRCAECDTLVQHTSLGKYCVRFGYDIRQFCNSSCLTKFKKTLKICCYCQKDFSASKQVFRVPGFRKDFCSQSCVDKFDQMTKNPVPQPVWAKCTVCSLEKATMIEMEVTETTSQRICSDPCFAAYKFANNILPDQCKWCKKYFERKLTNSFTTYDDSNPNCFCSLSCMTIHINHTRFLVPCDRCQLKKYNFDMIRRMDDDQPVMMCSLHCLSVFQESEDVLSLSNGVPPPTLATPVSSVEQGGADVMALAAEQLITLTKSLKRRETTQSSEQEEHQRNESAKKIKSVIPDSRSGPKKETRSSSIRPDSPPSSESRPVSEIATPVKTESSASPPALANSDVDSNGPRARGKRPSQAPPSTHNDIADIVNYGSEEDSDDEDIEESCPYVCIPRTARLNYQDMDEEVEVAVNSAPVYEWPPPHIRTPSSSPFALTDPPHMPFDKWHFEWRPSPIRLLSHTPRRETFAHRDTDCGPQATTYQTPYEAFTSIWSLDVMELIARETNRYAKDMAAAMLAAGSMKPGSRIRYWKDTTTDELYLYFAVILATGITVKSRMDEYWNKDKAFFNTPLFASIMSFDRFRILSKCLHFGDNSVIHERRMTKSQIKLHKIQSIIDHLNSKFGQLYKLSQNIALDESLTQYRGWLDHKCNNHKAATVGVKTYEICEVNTGYLWRLELHAGHDTVTEEESPVSGSIPSLVLRLLKGLEGQGYTVWMDSYYNSPALARELKSQGFDCVGTLRTNRHYIPEELAALKKQNMVPGEIVGCTAGDIDCVVWRDKNRLSLISTYHGLATWECNGVKKPTVAKEYNSCMASLDRKDQMLAMFPMEKRTRVWYKKLFRRLLNASVLNAHIMHRKSNPTVAHRDFRKELCKQLHSEHSRAQTAAPPSPLAGHFPAEYAHYSANAGKRTEPLRRLCNMCKKRTKSYCEGCDVALCLFDCFKRHHLNLNGS